MLSRSQIDSFKQHYGDREERHLRNESQVNVGIPAQVRAMREMRGWTQKELADKMDTAQNTISRLESSRAHAPNVSTLLRLAEVFDVALLVRFAPFSDFYDFNTRASHKSVAVPEFDEDVADLEKQSEELEDAVSKKVSASSQEPAQEKGTSPASAQEKARPEQTEHAHSMSEKKPTSASSAISNQEPQDQYRRLVEIGGKAA